MVKRSIIQSDNRDENKYQFITASRKSILTNAIGIDNYCFRPSFYLKMYEAMCVRATLILDALRNGYDKVLWLDTDTIVRKPLDGIWKFAHPSSISVLYRPNCKPDTIFNTGVIAIGNSSEMIEFIKHWRDGIKKPENKLSDQLGLYETYRKHGENIKLHPLEEKYNDCKFKDDSVIWHAKGHHRKNKKYLKEVRKYVSL